MQLQNKPELPSPEEGGFRRHYEEETLPGFSYFRHLTRGDQALIKMEDLGYRKGARPDFNAFARRLRVAVCIRVEIEGMGEGTSAGYAALTQHFLMFTAFERYANEIVGVQERRYHEALPFCEPRAFKEIHRFIKETDLNDALWNWLMGQKANRHQGSALLSFRNGFDPMKAVYVSAMLRNTFAHGYLTANPKDVEAGCVKTLCLKMCALLYQAMAEDFWQRLGDAEKKLMQKGKLP